MPAMRSAALLGVAAVLALTGCGPSPEGSAPGSEPSSSPAPAHPASGGGTPTRAGITRVMAHTVEAGHPSTHFVPAGIKATAPDGEGGTFTAVAGRRTPSADGHGMVVFFWHGRHLGRAVKIKLPG